MNSLPIVLTLFALLQIDWGGTVVAPIAAAIAAAVTVYGRWKQARDRTRSEDVRRQLEAEINQAKTKQEAQDKVVDAWSQLFQTKSAEMNDVRSRLTAQERHTRICEKTQLKLVAQLIKSGVDVDLDAILKDLESVELTIVDAR